MVGGKHQGKDVCFAFGVGVHSKIKERRNPKSQAEPFLGVVIIIMHSGIFSRCFSGLFLPIAFWLLFAFLYEVPESFTALIYLFLHSSSGWTFN